jgi:hypothetical protein
MKTRLGGQSMSQACATPVESAIVPWYWFGADINTGAADEDDRDLSKVDFHGFLTKHPYRLQQASAGHHSCRRPSRRWVPAE